MHFASPPRADPNRPHHYPPLPLSEFAHAIEIAWGRKGGAIKVLLIT